MKLLAAFLYVFLAGMGRSHGWTYPAPLPITPHNSSLVVPHTQQQSSDVHGRVGNDWPDMPRIIGGSPAELHEFPWMVSLQDAQPVQGHICGASVIDKSWVVTAAHCVMFDDAQYSIMAGDHILTDNQGDEQGRVVEKIFIHPKYNIMTKENDIALLKLAEPLNLDGMTVSSIRVPSPQDTYTGDCVVIGWGTTETSSESDILRKVVVPIVADDECKKMYEITPCFPSVYDSMICAGYIEGGKDACQGDSGGSLVCQGADKQLHVTGIVSWGNGCAKPNYPGVYTEVSYSADWINEVMSGSVPPSSSHNTEQFPFAGEDH